MNGGTAWSCPACQCWGLDIPDDVEPRVTRDEMHALLWEHIEECPLLYAHVMESYGVPV